MKSTILETRIVTGRSIHAVLGDLTDEPVDAIVNAANSRLIHGGGLAGAIVRRGGQIIQRESRALAPVPVGSAVTTTAGDLPCRWVIHAVGPRWGDGDEETRLRSAVRASLDEAERLGARGVSLPAISTGIFGYPKEEGTRTIVAEIVRWLDAHPKTEIVEIRCAAFDEETAQLFAAALRDLD
jgi:O-acetyl-ADP-ribose deacetylase (regulator of RNase III)